MKNILKKLVWFIMAAPAIFLAIVWQKIPATVPLHFDIKGNADRYGSKNEMLILLAIVMAVSIGVYLLLFNLHRIDPKKNAADNKDRLQNIAFAVAVFMSAISCMIIYSSYAGSSRFDVSLILAGVGLLFAIIGNYMPNMKPNYFAGLRLPWTLESPTNWKKTHALAGKLWFGGGLALAITCLFIPGSVALIVLFVVTGIITLIPCIYSYKEYKKEKQSQLS